jgi:hypothetical protein
LLADAFVVYCLAVKVQRRISGARNQPVRFPEFPIQSVHDGVLDIGKKISAGHLGLLSVLRRGSDAMIGRENHGHVIKPESAGGAMTRGENRTARFDRNAYDLGFHVCIAQFISERAHQQPFWGSWSASVHFGPGSS